MPDDVPEGPITPEDIQSQVMVVRTKDNRVAVQFPIKDGGMDGLETLKLLATGLNFVVETLCQQQDQEKEAGEDSNFLIDLLGKKPRIVLAPAVPKEFLTKKRPD